MIRTGRFYAAACFSCVLAWTLCGTALAQPSIGDRSAAPYLHEHGTAKQLVVGGRPYLVRGGELSNSAATTLESMEPIWPRLVELNLNTVLVPAYWDLIEPREGEFDFTLVDGVIDGARRHDMRVVFLWFASWKNSMSCYAPAWVKADQRRFPRSVGGDGRGMEILSPFDDTNAEADARAFAQFMRHLHDVDGRQHTVIMVQVENEIGMIPAARDHSDAATRLYHESVPRGLMDYLVRHDKELIPEFRAVWQAAGGRTAGTWEEVFGPGVGTEEIFMAWHFARYTNRVAEAGKREYELPMFVNAALIRPNYPPGRYPSAGPLPHLIDVWRAGGPEIDFLSPDIYFPNFSEWCTKYARSGNPLFIPEAVRGSRSAANIFYALGEHDAIGLCPFAIDHLQTPAEQPLTKSYDLVRQITPLVLEHQGQGTMAGLLADVPFDAVDVPTEQTVSLGDYTMNVRFEKPREPEDLPGLDPGQSLSGGLVIQLAEDELLFAGTGIIVTFETLTPEVDQAGIESVQQGTFDEHGQWHVSRWLGGDATHQGRHIRIPPGQWEIQRVKLYRYR